MSADPNAGLREQVLALMPLLRAFGRSLTNNRNDADDLVQDTLLKALTNFDKFTEGTNLRAWLFTIMRNTFYSGMRKGRNEVADSDGSLVASLSVQAPQEGVVAIKELAVALQQLASDQREALILVGAMGLSYEEAADICGCAIGTIKSRVNRARSKLVKTLQYHDLDDLDDAGDAGTGQTAADLRPM